MLWGTCLSWCLLRAVYHTRELLAYFTPETLRVQKCHSCVNQAPEAWYIGVNGTAMCYQTEVPLRDARKDGPQTG